MRLTLLALIGVLCLAYSHAQPLEDNDNDKIHQNGLLDVVDQGENHANDGNREARQWGGGGWGGHHHHGWGGGWGGGGWGGGGWGGGGWGGHHHGWGGGWGRRGGWGGGGWGGGWGR